MKKSLDWTIMEEFVGRLTDLWENENWQKVNHHDHTTAKKKGVAEGFDIGQEWMSDTELDQYVPERLQQQWRELLGYDRNGNPSALWANLTGGYEPDVNDPQHRRLMVKVANKWFAAKKIPNVKFFDVKDADDELEWLVQIGEQGVAEATPRHFGPKGAGTELARQIRANGELDRNKQPEPTGIPKKNEFTITEPKAKIQVKKNKGVAEGHADQQRRVFKKNGEAVGEVGIDRESSPGNGQWYMKHYASGKDLAGYDSYEEAVAELKHCMKQGVAEDWNKVNHHDKTNGLSQKAVNAYRHEHPGSKLKTAVTTKPSKLKAGSKDAKRRKSFCARMSGNEGPMKKPNGEPTPKALALRRWNCE